MALFWLLIPTAFCLALFAWLLTLHPNVAWRVVPPEDDAVFAIALEQLIDNDEKRLQLGMQARVYCEKHLACDTVLGRLQEQFASITQVPPSRVTANVFNYPKLNERLTDLAP